MKKKQRLLLFLFLLTIFLLYINQPAPRIPLLLSRKLDSSLYSSSLLYYKDSHGGFHGDGSTIAVVRIHPHQVSAFLSAVAEHPNWHPLPLDRKLSVLLQKTFPGENGEAFEIPEPERGWFYFHDRHSQSTDPADTSQLFSRGSFNYDLAIYDIHEATLWFFALDT